MNPLDARRRLLGRNVYKRTTEGNPAIAQGSLARRYPGITMQGWTVQAQYEGKNLLVEDISAFSISNDIAYISLPEDHPEKQYTMLIELKDGKEDDIGFTCGFYDKTNMAEMHSAPCLTNGELVNTSGIVNSRVGVNHFVCFSPANEQFFSIYNVMYAEGKFSTLTYEPYTGGQPSPNPDYPQEIVSAGKYDEGTGKYQYEVKLTGANLFDYTDMLKEDGYVHSNFQKFGAISIKPFHVEQGKQYLLITKGSTVVTTDYSSIYFGQDDLEYFPVGDTSTKVLETDIGYSAFEDDKERRILLTASRTCEITKCMVHGAALSERYQVEEFGLLEYTGDINIPYEPYRTPQTVTLTSDRPLTKWDKLEKRNGQWGWVYKSAEIVLDGSEDWEIYPYYGNSFIINDPTFENRYESSFCDKYRNVNTVWTKEGIYNAYSDHPNNARKYFKPPSAEVQTVEQWKTWLSENPLTLWYETAEETFVPLSSSEQEQMNAIYTFRPTTVLSNDCECEMTLTYKTKKSLEVTE